jgi:hypothetical protein
LANEKTPLRDTAPATPERAQKSADRSTVARRRVIVGIGILVVLGVALFLLLGGKDSPLDAINPFHSEAPVPTFEFTHVTSGYTATVAGANKDAQNKTSDEVATQVAEPVTSLFQAGYVDPSSWGDAGAIEDLFTDDAQKQIEANIGVLTLGADAGATYASVQPSTSNLRVVTLTDGKGDALRALAEPEFTAIATHKDGTYSKITVTGTLFFVHDGNDWKIEAFSLNRDEKPVEAPPSASPSTSPTESP